MNAATILILEMGLPFFGVLFYMALGELARLGSLKRAEVQSSTPIAPVRMKSRTRKLVA